MHVTDRRQRPRDDAGFTLVEVLVAATVLVVGILATLALFASAQSTSKTSQRNEVGLREAEAQLEKMRGQCYGALTLTSSHTAPTADPSDPRNNINGGGRLVVTPAAGGDPELNEEIVTTPADKESDDGCTDADADGKVDPAVAPTSAVTIGSGSTAVTGTVYRFVTWRDEECPIANLTQIEDTVQDLRSITQTLAGTSGTLTSLIGPNGSLVKLIADTGSVKDTAGTASFAQRLLYPTIVTLSSNLTTLTGKLDPLYATLTLTPMLAQLGALLPELEQLLDEITQRIDLCDLSDVVDLDDFETLTTALTTLAPAIAALQTPIANVAAIVNPLVSLNIVQLLVASVNAVLTLPGAINGLTTPISNLTTVLNAIKADAANGQTRVTNLAASVSSTLDTLLNQPDTEQNTKRVTVAIWLDASNNGAVGLRKPVWASSVVSDPKDGVL